MNDVFAKAQCSCGQLKLEVTGAPVVQLICHCKECRDMTHSPYTGFAFYKSSDVASAGETISVTMKGGSGQDKTYFACAECETPLYGVVQVLNNACAIIESAIRPFEFMPEAHVWTSEKNDGVQIPDDALQAPKAPPKAIRDRMLSAFWS